MCYAVTIMKCKRWSLEFPIEREEGNSQGPLERFIKHKAQSYQEPQRKETPRGNPIGFSDRKYAATLMMLTAFSLKEISKMAGVSYGLLRKWRTETAFKRKTEENCREFVRLLIDELKTKYDTWKKEFSEYKREPSSKFDGRGIERYWNSIEAEANYYSPMLEKAIIDALLMLGGREPEKTPELLMEILNSEEIERWAREKNSKVRRKIWNTILTRVRNISNGKSLIIEGVIDILKKPTISDEDRKAAIFMLEVARDRIMPVNMDSEKESK
jgi:hypothetical protein